MVMSAVREITSFNLIQPFSLNFKGGGRLGVLRWFITPKRLSLSPKGEIVSIMDNVLSSMAAFLKNMSLMSNWLWYDDYETNADNNNIGIDIIEGMGENWQLSHIMHGNLWSLKSICNPCEEESRTYIGYVNKICIHNSNHGK